MELIAFDFAASRQTTTYASIKCRQTTAHMQYRVSNELFFMQKTIEVIAASK